MFGDNTVNGELVSCLGRKNRASQLNQQHGLPLGSKLFQGVATMTYTRSHTRPSQKELGWVVYPLITNPWLRLPPHPPQEEQTICVLPVPSRYQVTSCRYGIAKLTVASCHLILIIIDQKDHSRNGAWSSSSEKINTFLEFFSLKDVDFAMF